MKPDKTERYNILYTTSFGHMAGGGQWSLYYLIKHLNKELFHPVVLCPGEGELAEKMRHAGADIVFLKIGRIRYLNPFSVLKLIDIIKKLKIHVIHTDSTTETFYAGIVAKIKHIPLIWHIRVSDSEKIVDRFLSILSDRLILVSKGVLARFRWLENSKKPVVIYNAVDLEEFDSLQKKSSIRQEFNIDRNIILLGCIGRIEQRKGQEYLVHAMKHVDDAKLLIIGKGERYFTIIKTMIDSLGISDKIIFTGHRNDIPSILKEIDILVFPNILGEGFPRVVLEAMAAGRPVVATKTTGNTEAVIDGVNGYIVPAKDHEALADRINELVRDKEKRIRMGLKGRGMVEESFTIDRNVKQVEGLYLEVLQGV